MVSVCLPSDALSQLLPSYLGFSYLGCGVSLHGCSSKAQPLLLTLEEGYLLTATPPDLECGVAPLGLPAPTQPPLLGCGVAPLQVRKQQLELDMEQQTGSKYGKEYIKAVCCHPVYLTYMQSTSSCKISSWMKHKLESSLPGETSITSDMQMTPLLWQKTKN